MKKEITIAALLVVGLAGSAAAQGVRDATQSRWYRATGWVPATHKTIDRATKLGRFVPPNYRPHHRAFKYGWKAGNYIEKKARLGERLYNRLENGRR